MLEGVLGIRVVLSRVRVMARTYCIKITTVCKIATTCKNISTKIYFKIDRFKTSFGDIFPANIFINYLYILPPIFIQYVLKLPNPITYQLFLMAKTI